MKKNFFKTVFLTMAVLFITVYSAPKVYAQDVPQAVVNAKESVVRVVAMLDDNTIYGWGSGFIIAQDGGATYIVTNRHVVTFAADEKIPEELWDQRIPKIKIFLTDKHGAAIDAEIIFLTSQFDYTMDLAFLKVSAGLSNRPVLPLADSSMLKDGMNVYALGFPGVSDLLDDRYKDYPSRTSDVTLTSGGISRLRVPVDGRDYIQHFAIINSGNSGGPLLNSKGAVVGVNTVGITGGSGVYGAIYIDYIIESCKELGIPYKKAGRGILSYWWVILIIPVILIAVYALLQLLKAGKSKSAQKPAASPAPVSGSRLICTKGHFAGTNFPLNGSLSIGRDPKRCQIIFPNETKGISSMHCMIQKQGERITLTDMGSSYGTFLAGGRRLNVNESVSLKSGDSFYLADTRNEFRVM